MRGQIRIEILGLLLTLLAASAAPGEGFRPMPRFAPGDVVRYRMTLSILLESSLGPVNDSSAAGQSIRGAVDITWRVEAISQEADGTTQLRAVIEALEVEPPEWSGMTQPEDFLGQAIRYRLSPDGRVKDVRIPDRWEGNATAPAWLGVWLDLSPGDQPGLSSQPLKPGDRWKNTRSRDIPGLPRQREASESEYLRNEVRGEVPCAAILTNYSTSGSDTREDTGPDGGRVRTERRLEGEGDRLACHDLATGRVVESTLRSRERLRLRVDDISHDPRGPGPPLVLETRTQLESHLRVVN